jgi:hypothetical protein
MKIKLFHAVLCSCLELYGVVSGLCGVEGVFCGSGSCGVVSGLSGSGLCGVVGGLCGIGLCGVVGGLCGSGLWHKLLAQREVHGQVFDLPSE